MACRQIAGIQERSIGSGDDAGSNGDAGADGVVCASGISFATSACQACADQNCCAKATACGTSPDCAPYETCLAACGGVATCRSQCAIDNPVGPTTTVPTLDQCLASHCDAECGLGRCGGLVFEYVPEAVHCAGCVQGAGCSEEKACATSEDCQAYTRCRHGCRADDCEVACSTAHPYGWAVWGALYNSIGTCRADCQLGGDWSCLKRVAWPFAKGTDIGLTVSVNDYVGGAPLGAIDVKMCATADMNCANAIDHGKTDSDGKVVLQQHGLVGNVRGLDGYLDISSLSMAIVPTLHFWSFPLSEPDATFVLPVYVLSSANFDTLRTSVGVPVDATRGHLWIHAYDCSFFGASGVEFAVTGLDASSKAFYLVSGQASLTATATDQSGNGGFFNVPVGRQIDVIATPQSLGRPSTHVVVDVRAGAITVVSALPTP